MKPKPTFPKGVDPKSTLPELDKTMLEVRDYEQKRNFLSYLRSKLDPLPASSTQNMKSEHKCQQYETLTTSDHSAPIPTTPVRTATLRSTDPSVHSINAVTNPGPTNLQITTNEHVQATSMNKEPILTNNSSMMNGSMAAKSNDCSEKRITNKAGQPKKWDTSAEQLQQVTTGIQKQSTEQRQTTTSVNGLPPVHKSKPVMKPAFRPAVVSTSKSRVIPQQVNITYDPMYRKKKSMADRPLGGDVEWVVEKPIIRRPQDHQQLLGDGTWISPSEVAIQQPVIVYSVSPVNHSQSQTPQPGTQCQASCACYAPCQTHVHTINALPPIKGRTYERPRTSLRIVGNGEGEFDTVAKSSYKNFRVVSANQQASENDENAPEEEIYEYDQHKDGQICPGECTICAHLLSGHDIYYEEYETDEIEIPREQQVYSNHPKERVITVEQQNQPYISSNTQDSENGDYKEEENVWTAVHQRAKPFRPQSSLTVSGRFKQHLLNQPEPPPQQRRHYQPEPLAEQVNETHNSRKVQANQTKEGKSNNKVNNVKERSTSLNERGAQLNKMRNSVSMHEKLICDHCRSHQLHGVQVPVGEHTQPTQLELNLIPNTSRTTTRATNGQMQRNKSMHNLNDPQKSITGSRRGVVPNKRRDLFASSDDIFTLTGDNKSPTNLNVDLMQTSNSINSQLNYNNQKKLQSKSQTNLQVNQQTKSQTQKSPKPQQSLMSTEEHARNKEITLNSCYGAQLKCPATELKADRYIYKYTTGGHKYFSQVDVLEA